MDRKRRTVVVPFAGRLEDCYLLARVVELGHRVLAALLDTSSFGDPQEALEEQARGLGAAEVYQEDMRERVYGEGLRGVLRSAWPQSNLPPLWEAAEERVRLLRGAELAAEAGEGAVVAFLRGAGRALSGPSGPQAAGRLEIEGPSEEAMRRGLRERGLPCPASDPSPYCVREALWGTRITGGALDDPWEELPPELYPNLPAPEEVDDLPEEFIVEFERGLPVAAWGDRLDGVSLFLRATRLGRRQGVGRRLVCEASSGRRIAWEAPAFELLLSARRALERALLDEERLALKDQLARRWLGHFARGGESPVSQDIEAFLDSALGAVGGEVLLRLSRGAVTAVGLRPAGPRDRRSP